MSEPQRTIPLRFVVLGVNCRHCGAKIEVQIPDGLAPAAMMAECERQAEAVHPQCEIKIP